jgi:hypothetical protein
LHAFNDWGINVDGALRRGDFGTVGVHGKTALRTALTVPALVAKRIRIQSRRTVRDADLFAHADDLTPSMVWRNLPELTSAGIRNYYAPLIGSGRTRPLPEVTPAGYDPQLALQ